MAELQNRNPSKGRGVAPPVVSVVSKSGVGKTTLLERLIPLLRGRGLRVGVLKHHSHMSSFDVPGKDTYRIAAAGADLVVGASPVQTAVFRPEDGSGDLDCVLAESFDGMDVVLTEGYKRGPHPKIEVHRRGRSAELLCDAAEMLALVTDGSWDLPVPQFGLDDVAALGDFLVDYLGGRE